MKIPCFSKMALAGAAITLLGGCATTPAAGPAALTGTWTNSRGTAWTINADGTFHVLTIKPKREVWGTVTLAGDTVTIQETHRAGPIRKECKGPGVYKFSKPNPNMLTFTLVHDACKGRIQNVTLPWQRK